MPVDDHESVALKPGDRIVVRTPDRREFRGVLVELREPLSGVVRLDTGWVTTYPLRLIFPDLPPDWTEPDRSSDSPSS